MNLWRMGRTAAMLLGIAGAAQAQTPVEIQITNNGDIDYQIVASPPDVAASGAKDPVLQLTTGSRYRIVNLAVTDHPLNLVGDAGEILLSQSIFAFTTMENDPSINLVKSGNAITFTISPSLAAKLKLYNCDFHPGTMRGAISLRPNAVGDRSASATAFRLYQNSPNPFNPTTTIRFDLTRPATIRLTIHSLLGDELQVVTAGHRPTGSHAVTFDAADLPSGLYVYRLEADGQIQTRRLTVIR